MNNMKVLGRRWMSIVIVVVLSMALMVGCAGNSPDETANTANDGSGGNSSGNMQNSSETSKEVGYPKSITYWAQMNPNLAATKSSMGEVVGYRELEKITGTKVEFKHPSADPQQAQEQFNLMIASRNLTDVIFTKWLTVTGGPENAINDGVILRLNDLIDQHAPNLKAYLDEHPEIEKRIKSSVRS